ncbi:MAG TPA: 4'-phosphopantetheinyl transferase superfamily protein [Rhodocyclaceae bacterium]|nr:4'-phosphopantetheinyl transferase superfamily protein [Rhodocyclaceae bacterium]
MFGHTHSSSSVIQSLRPDAWPADHRVALLQAAAQTVVSAEVANVVAIPLDLTPGGVASLYPCLSMAERQRAVRIHRDADRRRYVVGRARLRQMLAERLEVKPTQVMLAYGKHGKPQLDGHQAKSGWQFNLSRCGETALAAFARHTPVGVDLEAVRLMDDADNLAAGFFSSREVCAYQSLLAAERPLGFFYGWTRKEAFLKALGEGLSRPLADFDVALAPREPACILRVGATAGDRCGWRLYSIGPVVGLVAALVVAEPATY